MLDVRPCPSGEQVTHPATFRDDMRGDPGYATENVVAPSDDERALTASFLAAIQWATEPETNGHRHDGYGWRGCGTCRRVEAERIAARFHEGR